MSVPPIWPHDSRINVEQKPPSEDLDIRTIVEGILAIQARVAAEQHRPLGRGTHAKGIAARATFEVFDLALTQPDRVLAARLAAGIYARPGTYPVVVRFANAESHVFRDSAPDVRACSFWIDVPGGVLGPDAVRLDYSMNNAPTFPINDAHAFAALTKIVTASSMGKGFRSLPLRDQLGFIRTAIIGARQKNQPIRPYQQMRYWSTVPFRHGQGAAIKYSAIPHAGNAAAALGAGADFLQDELIRHLNEDATMSAFDFGLQFLDTERMTSWGRRRDASYWIDNACVEWNERQSPFHPVARLTLLPKSQLSADECEGLYIDVTRHSTADCTPLGSINRARSAAETASRQARLGRA